MLSFTFAFNWNSSLLTRKYVAKVWITLSLHFLTPFHSISGSLFPPLPLFFFFFFPSLLLTSPRCQASLWKSARGNKQMLLCHPTPCHVEWHHVMGGIEAQLTMIGINSLISSPPPFFSPHKTCFYKNLVSPFPFICIGSVNWSSNFQMAKSAF